VGSEAVILKGGSSAARTVEKDPTGSVRRVTTLESPLKLDPQETLWAGFPTLTSNNPTSDELLLKELQRQNNKNALSLLFKRNASFVRNIAYRILRNEAEADDLVQDVFLFIYRKAALFDASRGSARSWIIQVAYHRAFDRRRHLNTRHFYASCELDDAALAVRDRRYEDLFYEWSMEAVWGRESAAKLRELLSPGQLATIELHFFEGYTLEEIAARLGQTLGNVRNHYYRALEKLRKPAFAGKLRSK
jgi:RNA polymerase sigma-70 factor, ECF subfamily